MIVQRFYEMINVGVWFNSKIDMRKWVGVIFFPIVKDYLLNIAMRNSSFTFLCFMVLYRKWNSYKLWNASFLKAWIYNFVSIQDAIIYKHLWHSEHELKINCVKLIVNVVEIFYFQDFNVSSNVNSNNASELGRRMNRWSSCEI